MKTQSAYLFIIVVIIAYMAACTVPTAPTTTPATPTTQPPAPTITIELVPTVSLTLTSTPFPHPDSKAMIRWQELDLPENIKSYSPYLLGIGEGEIAYSSKIEDELVSYPIDGSFIFLDEKGGNAFWGFSTTISQTRDWERFDSNLDDLNNFHNFGQSNWLDYKYINKEDSSTIGDRSKGATITYTTEGTKRELDEIVFRVGKIAAFVFIDHPEGENPSVEIEKLAKVYAKSILNPIQSCQITSVDAVDGAAWPTYYITAEGFYPGEQWKISTDGVIIFEGNPEGAGSTILCDEDEFADEKGNIEDIVTYKFPHSGIAENGVVKSISEETVAPPAEVIISIQGDASGCEATRVVPWPLP